MMKTVRWLVLRGEGELKGRLLVFLCGVNHLLYQKLTDKRYENLYGLKTISKSSVHIQLEENGEN